MGKEDCHGRFSDVVRCGAVLSHDEMRYGIVVGEQDVLADTSEESSPPPLPPPLLDTVRYFLRAQSDLLIPVSRFCLLVREGST